MQQVGDSDHYLACHHPVEVAVSSLDAGSSATNPDRLRRHGRGPFDRHLDDILVVELAEV